MPLPPTPKTKPHPIIFALLLLICPVVFGAEWRVEWEKTFGGDRSQWFNCVRETEDTGFILCGFSLGEKIGDDEITTRSVMESYLVKTNASGHLQWEKAYEGFQNAEEALTVIQTTDGGYVFLSSSGYYDDYIEDQVYEIRLTKINPIGDILWNKIYTDLAQPEWNDLLDITDDGGFILVGRNLIKTDSNGDMEWSKPLDGRIEFQEYFKWTYRYKSKGVKQTLDGGYLITGELTYGKTIDEVYENITDATLIKTNTSGDVLWSKVFGVEDSFYLNSCIQCRDGGFLLGGSCFSGGDSHIDTNAFMLKTNRTGETQWYREYNSGEKEFIYAVTENEKGGYAFCGALNYFQLGISSPSKIFVGKVNDKGALERELVFGEYPWNQALAIQQLHNGGYVIAGSVRVSVDVFSSNAYLAKIAPAPSRYGPRNDLNGDDISDIILKQKSTGQVRLSMMQDEATSWTVSYASNWGEKYELLGTGDLNGDGRDDMILKYNPSQTVYLCEMNETATSWNVSYYSQGFYEKYDLLGIGDLNGDGRDDLILKYKPSNTVYICLMNEPGAEKIWTVAYYSQGWAEKYSLLGVGDLNDDARDDLILRYNKSGTVYFCHMRESGASWDIAATETWGSTLSLLALADLNGDFRKDLLVSDSEGLTTAWITDETGSTWTKTPAGDWSAYDILFTGDLNADYRDDLIRQTRATKQVEFLLTNFDDPTSWTASYTADWSDVELLNR